ncbi:hypothetical protein [Edaphocola flava]|uniref:hypothetical protein n=1 Tax=Edaphocola flava TaxID=2499629 RepID=UPI00100A7FB8|nr:hypothetical protein [Edaphocola flava]
MNRQVIKTTTIFILLVLFFFSCNGQKRNANSGYYGQVKKVTSYSCSVKQGKLPNDTADYDMKATAIYDSLGNKLEDCELYKSHYNTEILTIYSGTGKNRTYKTKTIWGADSSIVENTFKYIWKDDYNFTVISKNQNDSLDLSATTTLDRKFRTVETIYKSRGKFAMKDEFKYSGKYEKALKRTIDEGKSDRVIYTVTVAKEFDDYGNPIVAYCYDDSAKEHLTAVVFYKYDYYEK